MCRMKPRYWVFWLWFWFVNISEISSSGFTLIVITKKKLNSYLFSINNSVHMRGFRYKSPQGPKKSNATICIVVKYSIPIGTNFRGPKIWQNCIKTHIIDNNIYMKNKLAPRNVNQSVYSILYQNITRGGKEDIKTINWKRIPPNLK